MRCAVFEETDTILFSFISAVLDIDDVYLETERKRNAHLFIWKRTIVVTRCDTKRCLCVITIGNVYLNR